MSEDDKEIMALKHKKYPIEGIQFHPESVMTSEGPKILLNFLSMIKR
jgi:anthranilate/para-aminobenzoate synthase component II